MAGPRGPQRLSALARLTRRRVDGGASLSPPEPSPSYRARAIELLERWQTLEAEHELTTDAQSRRRIADSMASLRTAYQHLVRSAAVEGAPLPPPFPYHEPPGTSGQQG